MDFFEGLIFGAGAYYRREISVSNPVGLIIGGQNFWSASFQCVNDNIEESKICDSVTASEHANFKHNRYKLC